MKDDKTYYAKSTKEAYAIINKIKGKTFFISMHPHFIVGDLEEKPAYYVEGYGNFETSKRSIKKQLKKEHGCWSTLDKERKDGKDTFLEITETFGCVFVG